MSYSIETQCQHLLGSNVNDNFGAISTPIFQTAAFAHRGFQKSSGYDYSRCTNPTRDSLQERVAQLEHGKYCIAFSSGMAAITAVLERFHPGDEIIIEEDLYGGSIRLFDQICSKNGVRFVSVPLSETDFEPFITENTRAVYIETPTNPLMHVIDLEKTSGICKKHGLEFIVDNTFLSPYFQNPLDFGADIVIHSGTKFLSGHHDTLAGFTITSDEQIAQEIYQIYITTGASLAPFDSWLVERGIKTLAVRMDRAAENADRLARFLKDDPHVTRVLYPGLEDHPGHEIMKKQARGYGAMITFDVPTREFAAAVLENLEIILFAESLGGTESLMTHPATQTHHDIPEEVRIAHGIYDTTLRLSVGIEGADDLIEDLKGAFAKAEEALQASKAEGVA